MCTNKDEIASLKCAFRLLNWPSLDLSVIKLLDLRFQEVGAFKVTCRNLSIKALLAPPLADAVSI
jgi:hypothetical protein